jgi:DNA-directed RNA polymerase
LDLRDTEEATRRKFEKNNAATTKKGRRREAMEIPAIQRAAEPLLPPLVKYFEENPAPDWLTPLIAMVAVPPTELALATTAVTLDHIYQGRDDETDPREVGMLIKKDMGEKLRSHLASKPAPKGLADWAELTDWDNEKRVVAGHWMMRGIPRLACLRLNHLGEPEIAHGRKIDVNALREEMMRLDQVFMPFTKEPPDWAGFRKQYGGSYNRRFVRGAPGEHPDTAKLIDNAFLYGFPHAKAVNSLKRVSLMVDPVMIGLVERYGERILNEDERDDLDKADKDYGELSHKLERIGPPTKLEWSRARYLRKKIKKTTATIEANTRTVDDDVRVARKREGEPFWLDYNCDFRGRVYAVQHFNYMRGDHVRSLFKFANGIPLTENGLAWLEVHCANCEGSTDKEKYGARQKWVSENKSKILKIATDPDGTFEDWREADKPFAYVAACRELKAAWEHQKGFDSHLPIPLDGSCNGIQHLALLNRDADVAKLVNLVGGKPQDIYLDVAVRVRELVNNDDGELASWWRACFSALNDRQMRKLCKQPVMTFGYGVTPSGMVRQLVEAYKKLRLRRNSRPPEKAFGYLADQINHVAKEELLRGPAEVMEYVKAVAAHCASEGRLMEWTSPTGFPCVNRYQKPNVEQISIGSGAMRVRHRVGIGCGKEILADDALRGAAPNFTHSQDAAHLAHTVNMFGKDILTIHDSFSCHAENVEKLHHWIRAALLGIYLPEDYQDWLVELRRRNVSSDDFRPPPSMGDLDVIQMYFFSPYSFD